jgi:glycosyltransferase involved in cell wall biosynthesis
MRILHLLLPGDLEARTGGSSYDRRLVTGLRVLDWAVRVHSLDPSFPMPTPAAVAGAARVLDTIDDGALVVIDGLALGAMPRIVAPHRDRLRLVALVHHPLALETGLSPSRAERLRASETAALHQVRRVIVTSPFTARLLGDFGVASDRIRVVLPGTDPAPVAPGSTGGPVEMLCVGAVTPRKGQMQLIDALATLTHLHWRLSLVGSLERSPVTAAALRARITRHGLDGRVRLLGAVPDDVVDAWYAAADLFVLPSLFEGYGMAYAEALARGLPVLGTRGGAIPETVPPDAGILVEPGEPRVLAEALARLLTDAELRRRLRAGALRARARLSRWDSTAAGFAAALADV